MILNHMEENLSIDYFNKNVSCKTPHCKTIVQHHCFYYLCQNYMVQMHSLCYFNLIQGKTEKCGEIYKQQSSVMTLAMLLNHYPNERIREKL